MQLRPETSKLLAELQTLSGDRLTRVNDLGVLLDLGTGPPAAAALQELSFLAKFLSRTYGIMKRIGPGGNGYGTLLSEFNDNLRKVTARVQELLAAAPPGMREHFRTTYFAMTPEAMENFLALLYDLSWYKNWLLDHRGTAQ